MYGEWVLDMVFGMFNFILDKKEFDMVIFFGEWYVMWMIILVLLKMIVDRLIFFFGEDC